MGIFSRVHDLPRLWYRRPFVLWLLPLLPLSWLFGALAALRRKLYRSGALHSHALPVPVIVVGNLTVGGSGKTPFVLWLVERLREAGWRPGIISRGYRGAGDSTADRVQAVAPDASARESGDEPLLLARRSGRPVFVGRDRVAAAAALLAAHPDCNVIVSDDGLQHYRLRRSVEIAVFDERGAGNGYLLPAGPLREPLRRLRAVTAIVWNTGSPVDAALTRTAQGIAQFTMRLQGERFHFLGDERRSCLPADLRGKRLHAIAGIGDPSRFFRQLSALGLVFESHPFPDHHDYAAGDFSFSPDAVVLMTEKDAVKCRALHESGTLNHCETWVLPVEAQVDSPEGMLELILEKLNGRAPA